MFRIILAGLAALGGIALIVYLTSRDIDDWVTSNTDKNSRHLVLLREAMENGTYGVMAGVLNVQGKETATNSWENVTLDTELEDIFGDKDSITLTI